MVRLAVVFATLIFSHAVFAGGVSEFFDRLQGKWVLTEGKISNHDGQGHIQNLKITELTSIVEKANAREWKFSEHYCVEADCVDTTYFYVLENDNDLYLVTQEGRSELVTLESGANNLRFVLQNGTSYSVTDCNLIGNDEMTQEGLTVNSDFTTSEVSLGLKKL